MKKQLLSLCLIGVFALTITSCSNESETKEESIPQLHEEKVDGPGGKNRSWTAEEAKGFSKRFSKIENQIVANRTQSESGSFADGELLGEWKNKGPFNMPGAFQFCEMDEGTDTVYAVTCGHYGGVQFIWKGTLKGDDWNLINPKHPFRYEDLIVLPNNNSRRVIAGRQEDKLMYSDDAGKNWSYVSGLSGIKSTILNRQDNNVIYSANGSKVYKSVDNGSTFQEFQSFTSSANNVRLYSPRWNSQPGASDVYLLRDGKSYLLNSAKTTFEQKGTLPNNGRIALSGDSRKIWATLDGKKWYYSTNKGTTFTFQPTISYWYSDKGSDMSSGQFIGVSPENPEILLGNYSIPLVSIDGGATVNADAGKYWGYYQNSVGNDPKVRVNYHPDFQSHQFFYDKNGDLLTLRSSDGGVFLSYNEWTKTSYASHADIADVYYNISLLNKPTQETYRGGFIYGYQNPDHLSCGTQDQGWQDTRSNTFGNEKVYWDQIGGGDGPCCITGDGKIGWKYNYQGNGGFQRFELYSGNEFKGQRATRSAKKDFSFTGSSYFTPSVGDWQDGNRIWVLSQSLRKIEYNVSNQQITAKEDLFGTGNSYMQGLAQSRVNADLVFAMRAGNVYKSTDRGSNWVSIATSSETGIWGLYNNRGMAWASPIDADKILFATQSGTAVKTVYSEDGGVSWQNVTGSGDNLFPSAEVNGMAGSKDGQFVFASTNMGPYVFCVATKKWHSLTVGTNVPVFWGQIVHCVDYGDKEIVHFSTWGQGVWSFEIKENLLANDLGIEMVDVSATSGCESEVSSAVVVKNKGLDAVNNYTVKLFSDNKLIESQLQMSSLMANQSKTITFSEFTIDKASDLRFEVDLGVVVDEDLVNNTKDYSVSLNNSIDMSQVTLVSYTTEETTGEGIDNGRVIHMFDGDNTTFWHSKWTGSGAVMPYEFVLDLGEAYDLSQLSWHERIGNGNGDVKNVKLYVSQDLQNWGTGKEITISHNTDEQLIQIVESGRYVKLEILSNYDNTDIASIGELAFSGCPKGVISFTDEESYAKGFKVFPNPIIDLVNIEANNLSRVELFDIHGKLVKQKTANETNKLTIDLSDQKSGAYVLKVYSTEGVKQQKVIKR